MSDRTVCAVCGKWIWLDPYGPGWVHKNQGIFAKDGHHALSTTYVGTVEEFAQGKARPTTCPTCGSDERKVRLPACQEINQADPWHTVPTETTP